MTSRRKLYLPEGQRLTMNGDGTSECFIEMGPGAVLTLAGKITQNGNIWGPGSLNIAGAVTVAADVGTPPAAGLILDTKTFPGNDVTIQVGSV